MSSNFIQVADDFWNVRGSFRIGGLIDVGTQVSLVRLRSGGFVFLDSYSLRGTVLRKINELTDDGRRVEAILNLHPFHTIHVQDMHERFPHAALYGTDRHATQAPDLPWDVRRTDSTKLHKVFADDFDFSVPRGVDFISDNDKVHFSSVLALHRSSATIHVDDTFMYVRLPLPLRVVGLRDTTRLHPTLSQALEKRAGAADDFHHWAGELIERWRDAQNLCAAHTATLTARDNRGASIHDRLSSALEQVEDTLAAHRKKYG